MRRAAIALTCALVACGRPGSLVGPSEPSPLRLTLRPSPPQPSSPPLATTPSPAEPAAEATLVLPIPARDQAPEAPPEGWCGETAIQEGLLYRGVSISQRVINQAGKPVHPDLYSTEIPIALTKLGVRYTVYSPARGGFDAFSQWVRGALEEGDPVLAGVKILPTEHPNWGLDHFVLVVGYGPKGLLVNTTWGTRQWVSDTRSPGLSFANAFYAIRLRGVTLPEPDRRDREVGR